LLAAGRGSRGGNRIVVMRRHLPALHHGGMDPVTAPYMIRINGHLGRTERSAFPALAPRTSPTVVAVTVSGGDLVLVIRGPG
jgi:hypothetical protein